MKNYVVRTFLLLAGLGLGVSLASAFEVEHEAHEHGHATLSIVQEKDELQLEFTSPAMNIVGFEHQPDSKEQNAKVDKAKEILSHADDLFVINKEADCSLEHAKVSSALLDDGRHEEHDHDKHHGEKHHDDAHHHDDHNDDTHSEFTAEYHFECEKVDALTSIQLTVFDAFSSLEEVEAKVISNKGQRLIELDHDNTKIDW